MHDRASRELARQWDGRDPLARFRKQFFRPAAQIYLDGNSLGLCSQEAERALLRVLHGWKTKGSDSWRDRDQPWSAMDERVRARLARQVGAAPEEVAIGHSRALNLEQLLATVYRRQFHRPRILLTVPCSSTDRRIVRNQLDLRGLDGESQLLEVDVAKLEAMMADPAVQIALLPMVVGGTGQLLEIPRLCRAARRSGVLVGLDLSHSLGIMPHALDEWETDFAFWEHDSFANAGPGAAAGLYLNRRHFAAIGQAGATAANLQIGPSPILGLAALEGSLRLLEEAGPERLRAKSLDLTHFLRVAIEGEIPSLRIVTPRDAEHRGGQLALLHPAAPDVCEQLREHGLSADCREPDIISLAPSPLYNSFVECWDAVQILRRVVQRHAQTVADHAFVS